jgi:nitronate monooxygenase
MNSWPDRRLLDLFGIEVPIIQAPMAGPGTPELAIAVSDAGGLGSLPCAQLGLEQTRASLELIRPCASRPLNLNFFCHTPPALDPVRALTWRARLAPYYVELGLDPEAALPVTARRPFDNDFCSLVEEFRPTVVSFHFGLPRIELLERVKAAGCKVISSATTVAEARSLEDRGCDVVNRIMREQGPLSSATPAFPLAAAALAPIKAKSEAAGSGDFTNLWSGQAVAPARRSLPAGQLTRLLAQQAWDKLAHKTASQAGNYST